MDSVIDVFENLKLSAFSKISEITGDINNVTLGPKSGLISPTKAATTCIDKNEEKSPIIEFQTSTLSPSTIYFQEFETQRKEKLQNAIDIRFNLFEKFTQQQHEDKQNRWLAKQRDFYNAMNETENNVLRILNETKPETGGNAAKYQELRRKKMEMEQKREAQLQKQKVLKENIAMVEKCQGQYGKVYHGIIEILKEYAADDEVKALLTEKFKELKLLQENFEQILSKCRDFSVTEEHVAESVFIVNHINSLKERVDEILREILSKRNRAEQAKIAEKQKQMEEQKKLASAKILKIQDCVSPANLKKYAEIKIFMDQYIQTFKELEENPQLKQFRFDCQKAVNIPLNTISSINASHLKDKYTKLSSLLSGRSIIVADKEVNASKFPQGIAFCTNLLAKKFIVQGDLMVSSNPEAAFCYASIIVALWTEFPDFGRLLLAHFYTQCPYLVPFYIPITESQSSEEHYLALGYRYTDGQIEKQDKFLKRMTGIFRLYFAILVAKPRVGQLNPHGIKQAWCFLAALLKLQPKMDITATALYIFLETAGSEMEAVYGKAFQKLVRIIEVKFLNLLKANDSGGPVSRLEVLLQEYRSNGRFEPPSGMLPANFW